MVKDVHGEQQCLVSWPAYSVLTRVGGCESVLSPLAFWEVGVVYASDGKYVSSQVFIHTVCS